MRGDRRRSPEDHLSSGEPPPPRRVPPLECEEEAPRPVSPRSSRSECPAEGPELLWAGASPEDPSSDERSGAAVPSTVAPIARSR